MAAVVCKFCNEPIRWAVTDAGKRMPLNPTPDRNGNVVLLPGGQGMNARVLSGPALLQWRGQLWMPHFVTCPHVSSPMRLRRPGT